MDSAARPGLRFGEAARSALLRGADQMTALLRPTLGPLPRSVAIARLSATEPPEVLDGSATIARRTLQLADPFADMGAMLIRDLVLRVVDTVGDGGATAAVLAHAMLRESARYIAAGANPVAVRHGLTRGLETALSALRRQARPVDGPEEIAALVLGAVGEPHLARVLAELLDNLGPDGAVLVQEGHGTESEHEYVEGLHWTEGYISRLLLKSDQAAPRLIDPRILITDRAIERPDQLVATLEACASASERRLFIVAPEVREPALAILAVNRDRGVLDEVVAVRAPGVGQRRADILEDLAVATGGRCIREACGERLEDVRLADLGRARQAWATRFAFSIVGGAGNRAEVRARVATARAQLNGAADRATRDEIRERIGKLSGTAAILRVGGATDAERDSLKLRVDSAFSAARGALESGVVLGGGAALVACRADLACARADSDDESAGLDILAHALVEPMRVIADNAGFDGRAIVHAAICRSDRAMFDVLHGQWSAPPQAVVDALSVLETALSASVSVAATASTTEVLVHRRGAWLAATR